MDHHGGDVDTSSNRNLSRVVQGKQEEIILKAKSAVCHFCVYTKVSKKICLEKCRVYQLVELKLTGNKIVIKKKNTFEFRRQCFFFAFFFGGLRSCFIFFSDIFCIQLMPFKGETKLKTFWSENYFFFLSPPLSTTFQSLLFNCNTFASHFDILQTTQKVF